MGDVASQLTTVLERFNAARDETLLAARTTGSKGGLEMQADAQDEADGAPDANGPEAGA